MFKTTVQPPLVSLFSSVGSHPLQFFSIHADLQLPEDSLIQLLNDSTSLPAPQAPGRLLPPPQLPLNPSSTNSQGEDTLMHLRQGKSLSSTVLHIQSPTLRTTFIHSPALDSAMTLGLKHAWMHLQVRNMSKEWAFEIGLVDVLGQEGRVRFATFQTAVQRHIESESPILVVPCHFPRLDESTLTSWMTVSVSLAQFCSRCTGQEYESISYVRVYATCRLRRIWFTDRPGVEGAGQGGWELALYE